MAPEHRPVVVAGVGLLCSAGIGPEGLGRGTPGSVPDFRGRSYISNRKSIKMMTRAVQLGVSAAHLALEDCPGWTDVPPDRRGIFVGASPQPGDAADLQPSMAAALDAHQRFSMGQFARDGVHLIHPLWLVRGLSNNILGFSSVAYDLQGVNANYCDGEEGGWNALVEGIHAVAESRADLVLAGGADALVGAEELLGGRACGEGAAFVVLRPASKGDEPFSLCREALKLDEDDLGFIGAATWPVALARDLLGAA